MSHPLHTVVAVNQIVDKNPLRIVTLLLYSNKKINLLNSEQVFYSIQLKTQFQSLVNELYKRSGQRLQTCTRGDRLRAENVLFWFLTVSLKFTDS